MTEPKNRTVVLYNANCPVCSFEINHYAAYSKDQALAISFDDLNNAQKLERWGLDADTAARRLYVLKDGELTSGIPAFLMLWEDMPKYRWLARCASFPGVFRISCLAYDYVLAPLIYRSHLRRLKKRT